MSIERYLGAGKKRDHFVLDMNATSETKQHPEAHQ